MAFPLVAPLVFTTVFTGIKAAIATIASYAFTRVIVAAAILSLTTFAGYLLADFFLPEWLSVATLQAAVDSFSPAVSYFLYLGGFYSGFPLCMTALALAWVVKKLPTWAWLGPLLRGAA